MSILARFVAEYQEGAKTTSHRPLNRSLTISAMEAQQLAGEIRTLSDDNKVLGWGSETAADEVAKALRDQRPCIVWGVMVGYA